MKIDWKEYIGKTLNITLTENYGLAMDTISDTPLYEIVFKTGKLINAYDEGLLLKTFYRQPKGKQVNIPARG